MHLDMNCLLGAKERAVRLMTCTGCNLVTVMSLNLIWCILKKKNSKKKVFATFLGIARIGSSLGIAVPMVNFAKFFVFFFKERSDYFPSL